jgi:hypothetical protein
MEAIEGYTKKKYDTLTPQELWAAQEALKINQMTGVFVVEPAVGTAGNVANLGGKANSAVGPVQQSATARRRSGPARNTRSKKGALPMMSGALPVSNDNGKRPADGSGKGQRSPKMARVI